MSISMQQLVSDAKQLANRLKDRDLTTDTLLNDTVSLSRKIVNMKKYQDDVEILNEIARHRPRTQLVGTLQQETNNIREVQQENRKLRKALEEHQIALERIMSKYREHTSKQIYDTRIDFKNVQINNVPELVTKHHEKIKEMVAIMQKAAACGEKEENEYHELMTKLIIENKGLREMLAISRDYDSVGFIKQKEDKHIQTDDIELKKET